MRLNAKEFSDKAAIVISRTGGEGADLPTDMGPIMDGSTMDIGTKYMKGSYTNNSSEYDDFQAGQSYLELSQTEKDLVDMVCSEFDDIVYDESETHNGDVQVAENRFDFAEGNVN